MVISWPLPKAVFAFILSLCSVALFRSDGLCPSRAGMENLSGQQAAGSPGAPFPSLEPHSEAVSPEPQFMLEDTDMELGLTGGKEEGWWCIYSLEKGREWASGP